jgi:hypothetical protein
MLETILFPIIFSNLNCNHPPSKTNSQLNLDTPVHNLAPEPSHDYLAKIAQPKLSANLVQLPSLAVMQIEGIWLCDVLMNVSTDYVVLLVVAPENVYRCSVSNKISYIRITVKMQSIKDSQPTSRPLSKNRPETAMLNAFVLG